MFQLRKPTDDEALRFLREQSSRELTYPEVGATADDSFPTGYDTDHARADLGRGERVFRAAVDAFRVWRQFDVGWAEALPADTPLAIGSVVAVRARAAGLWTLNCCRIVYLIDDGPNDDALIDDDGPLRRFGFGYGTLPGHSESGEERFLIEWDRRTDVVAYEISAFFRPRHPLARLGWSYCRRVTDRFRQDSIRAMQQATGSGSEPVC